jgi:glucan phosphoethanolaminetransferase (alkaline phosphatase superfamily)
MTEINNYYSEKYTDYIFIVSMIIVLCIIVIVLSILNKRSIISKGIYALLVIISCSIIAILIIARWISIRSKDPINYDQYKFYVPSYTPTTSPTIYSYNSSEGASTTSTADNSDNSTTGDGSSTNGYLSNNGVISGIIMDI